MCMKTVNDFQKPKVQPQLIICFIFSQFQSGVANESVAYIKKACDSKTGKVQGRRRIDRQKYINRADVVFVNQSQNEDTMI